MADHGIAYVPPPPCMSTALPSVHGYPKGDLLKREVVWIHAGKRAMVVACTYLGVTNTELWVSTNGRTWTLEGAFSPLVVNVEQAARFADAVALNQLGCHPCAVPYGFECGCGRLYQDHGTFARLPDLKVGPLTNDPELADEVWEQRLCPCGSHRCWPVSTLAWRAAWEAMMARLTRQSTRGFPPKVDT